MNFKEYVDDFKSNPFFSVKQVQNLPVYYSEFRKFAGKKGLTILEIGIAGGGSLHFYRKYFGEDARIIGIDLNPRCKELENFGFEIYIGDQSDTIFMNNLLSSIGPFDIVIDDGGHTNHQQISTMISAIPHINDDGIMIIEDLHCSYNSRWGNPSKFSTINFLKSRVDEINSRNQMNSLKHAKGVFGSCVFSLKFYDAMTILEINREACIPGTLIYSAGSVDDYGTDFRYSKSYISEKLYLIGKTLETNGAWNGSFKRTINLIMKVPFFTKVLGFVIKRALQFFEFLHGHSTRKFFE